TDHTDHTEDGVDRMRAALEATGARAVVEDEIAALAASSVRHFAAAATDASARREFASLVERAVGTAPAPDREGA
ncbi:MAG TPA: geranylgeranyl pyrophosphate synthase, partial [Streptomyces sp.]|nr:geranylgeranyl pyrophosphate synthase [Streptomyces sp.]